MASLFIRFIEGGMASLFISFNEGGMASLNACEGGVASLIKRDVYVC